MDRWNEWQMLMCMIGKLSRDRKADWLKHLPKLVHAYNSTTSAITGYSPHYLVYRCQLHLSIDFYFPTIRGTKKHQHVDHYITKLHEWLQEAFKEAQVHSMSEAERQKWYYNRKANAISLEPGDLVLAKANAYKGRRKVKNQWEEEPYEVECQVAEGILSYLMMNQQTGCLWVFHWNWLFVITSTEGTPLCTIVCTKWGRCTTTTLEEQTPEESETEEEPQSANCPLPAQHQTCKTPLGWVNRKLCIHLDVSWSILAR